MAAPLGMGQRTAMEKLRAIDAAIGGNDAAILRKVRGEGHTPAEAARLVCGDYRDTVTARLREALDALLSAWDRG